MRVTRVTSPNLYQELHAATFLFPLGTNKANNVEYSEVVMLQNALGRLRMQGNRDSISFKFVDSKIQLAFIVGYHVISVALYF